jgi:hypothetical protein
VDPNDVSTTTGSSETRESERRFIGRYEIRRLLGTGGMGQVYLAHDPVLDREVALKLIGSEIDDDRARQRLVEEARAAGRLRHPNIVTIFDAGEHAGAPYIAMEHVGGETLRGLIRRRAPLSLAHRLELIEGACAGLAHAHRANVVHFDVKPDNLMLDDAGVLKVLDFGIARVLKAEALVTKHLVGTLSYMSPEQVSGAPLDRRSDVFSLGCSLFELIAYAPAYTGSAPELVTRIAMGPVPRLADTVPSVDPRLDVLVARAMALDPAQRFDDLDELGAALGRLSQELEPARRVRRASIPAPSSATRTTPAGALPRRRRLVLAGVGAVSALAIGVGLVWMLGRRPTGPAPVPDPAPATASQPPSAPPQTPALVEPVASGAVPPRPSVTERPMPAAQVPAVPAAAGEDVWRRLARGDRTGVLELLRVAERREANPPIAHEVLDAVRPAALRARIDAGSSPSQRASAAYRSADESLSRANSFAEGGQPIEALGALWQAIDAFGSVATASRAAAAAVPSAPQAAPQEPARGLPPASNNAEPARTPAETGAPPPSKSDRDDVLDAIGRFHQAYTALDVAAVRQMYPTLGADQVEQLRRSFAETRSYEIDLRQPRVEVSDNTAVVRGLVVRRIVPRVGAAQTSEVDSEFRLQRNARGWMVVEVKAGR